MEPDHRQYPFYPANESTIRLDSFARYSVQFERFKESWSAQMPSEIDELAWIWDKEAFGWLPESGLIRWFAVLLVKGDVDGLERLTRAFKMYQDGWGELSNKDQAKVHMMTACNILWEKGRDRDEVTKGEIESRARMLWAASVVRRRGLKVSGENVQKEERKLPQVDWPLIRRELGLDDLKESKPGRKPIGNKER